MNTKTAIKVVKRNARRQENTTEETSVAKKTAQQAARDVVTTVTGWVNEFQQKRRLETSQAIKKIFPEATPQASKA